MALSRFHLLLAMSGVALMFFLVTSNFQIESSGPNLPGSIACPPCSAITPAQPKKLKSCFASILFHYAPSSDYNSMIAVAGYTLRKWHPDAELVLLTVPAARIGEPSIKAINEMGWTIRKIDEILQPKHFGDPLGGKWTYIYSKLRVWQMTDYDRVVFVDLDMSFQGPLNELLNLDPYWTFAAVLDNWYGEEVVTLNSGLLVVVPSEPEFQRLKTWIDTPWKPEKWTKGALEQGALDTFYHGRYLRLPELYNTNTAIPKKDCPRWLRILKEAKIFHHTTCKPMEGCANNTALICPWLKQARPLLKEKVMIDGLVSKDEEYRSFFRLTEMVIKKHQNLDCTQGRLITSCEGVRIDRF